jgi:LCP family protein required for cell wall assembly
MMSREDGSSDSGRPSKGIANGDRLVSLGEAVERGANGDSNGDSKGGSKAGAKGGSHRKTRSRRYKWARRGIIAVGLVIVLVVAGVVADYYYLGSLVTKKVVPHLQTAGATENILLIGSTDRCALKVQNPAYGLCSQGVTGINSDIDMIIHLDPATGAVSLLSIPRDLFVPNARITGANKIDAALVEGPGQLVAAIEEDFAIPINHYVELNFDTFASVVNALGGIKMYFPVPIFDAESGLNVQYPGCRLLDGYHALQVVRARHLQIQPNPSNHDHATWPQEALSDLARIRRTHEFLRVLAAKVAARGLGNPIVDQNLATAVLPDLTVDSGFSEGEMVSLARTFAHTKIANVPQVTYPVLEVETGSYLYQGYYYGDVEFPVQPTGRNTVDRIFGVKAGTSAFTGKALPSPASFRISVVDGAGAPSQAALVTKQLTAKGFRVTSTGTTTPVGPVSETVVWYGGPPPPPHGNWTTPALEAAQAVFSELQGPVSLGYDPKEVTPGALVTVQTGTDVSVKPTLVLSATATTTSTKSTSTTTSGAKTNSTTTTTTIYDPPGVSTNNSFSAPSPTNPALEPWDPRACNAAGTGPAGAPAKKK